MPYTKLTAAEPRQQAATLRQRAAKLAGALQDEYTKAAVELEALAARSGREGNG